MHGMHRLIEPSKYVILVSSSAAASLLGGIACGGRRALGLTGDWNGIKNKIIKVIKNSSNVEREESSFQPLSFPSRDPRTNYLSRMRFVVVVVTTVVGGWC